MKIVKKVCIICGHVHDESEGPLDDNYACPDCGSEAVMFEDQEVEV